MDFNDHCATPFANDARKRVEYNYGLVLGVGEFRTEQAYFLEKHRSHARGLHGYGTVAGLAVRTRDTANGPEVRVSPGLAIDPHGQEICVPETQCALLNNWLRQQQQDGDLSATLDGSPPGHVSAYVTLCHRECETDKVPIPVGPCHSLDTSSVPSRIQDAFELRLADRPPAQVEEDAIRLLCALMARVSVGTGPGALTTPDALVTEIRALVPDQSPPEIGDSIPPDFLLDPDQAHEILRTALRVFVTEVRPLLVPEGGGCLDGPRDATCVLLARLDFDIQDVGGVLQVLGAVQITQDDRPLLLSTSALQMQWFESMLPAVATGAEGTSPLRPVSLPDTALFTPAPVPGPRTLVLGPAAAEPVDNLVVRRSLGNVLPALRFRRNGAVTFGFPPPADLVPGTPFQLRLHWAYSRTTGAVPPLAWVATLRMLAVGDDLSASIPGASATIQPSISAADPGRLLATDPIDLRVRAPAQPLLGLLEVRLTSRQAIPQGLDIYLVSAELTYTERGGTS